MIATESRFRRRGGAKKKKKPRNPTPTFETPHENPFQNPAPTPPSSLPSDLTSYLTHIQSTLQSLDPDGTIASNFSSNPSEDPPASVLLSRNALLELAPRIHEVARDAFASRLVEALLRACAAPQPPAAILATALDAGPYRFVTLAEHHAASHVLDAALNALVPYVDDEDDARKVLNSLSETVRKWEPHEVDELINSPGGSHSFRTIVATLAGIPREEPREAKLDDSERGRILNYIDRMAVQVSDDWHSAIRHLTQTLLQADTVNMHDMLWRPSPCAALQALLSGVSVSDRELAHKFARHCMNRQEVKLMRNACGSRFVERAVLCLGASIVKNAYKGRLQELAKDAKANFVVQRILLGLKGRGEIMSAWDELEEAVPDMLGFGKAREGVVLSLLRASEVEGDDNCRRRASRCVARACGAVGDKAKAFVGILMFGSEDMWTRWRKAVEDIGRMGMGVHRKRGDVLRIPERVPSPTLLGSLIARCIMRFPGGPGQAVRDSMATLSTDEILALIGDAIASRLIEQWVDGETATTSQKIASKVVNAVSKENAEDILAVVRNPYGAQVIVKCVGVVAGPLRKTVMEALASDFEALKNDDCGQMVVRKCRLEQYMRRGEEWEHQETARETRERLFADILEDKVEAEREEVKERKKDKKDKRSEEGHERKRKKRKRTEIGEDEGEMEKVTGAKDRAAAIFDALVNNTEQNDNNDGSVIDVDAIADEEDVEEDAGLANVLGVIKETASSRKKDKKSKSKKKRRKQKENE